jgi:hypothetical protein
VVIAAIISAIKAIAEAFGGAFAFLTQRRLLEAGRAEAERDQLTMALDEKRKTDEKARDATEEITADPDDDVVSGRMHHGGF